MQIQHCEIHNYAIHSDNNSSVYDDGDDEGFAANTVEMDQHTFVQATEATTWKEKNDEIEHGKARHGPARIHEHFSRFLCPDDPSSMNAPSIAWIGISPQIQNNNQSTTAHNATKSYESRDDKTSIVTRHKCATDKAVTFDAKRWSNNNMDWWVLLGPCQCLEGSNGWETASCCWRSFRRCSCDRALYPIHSSYSHKHNVIGNCHVFHLT